MLRTAALVALVFAGIYGATGVSEGQADPAVAGEYRCEGTNPDGTPYQGVVDIAANDNTYLVRWTLPNNVTVMGVGLYREGVLSVSYFGGAPAVAVYKVDGERLVGQWTMGAEGTINAETLTKMKAGERRREPASRPRRPGRPVDL